MKKYDELKVFCKNTNEYLSIDGGETLIELYDTNGSRTAWLSIIGIGVLEMVIVAVMEGFDRKDYPGLNGTESKE